MYRDISRLTTEEYRRYLCLQLALDAMSFETSPSSVHHNKLQTALKYAKELDIFLKEGKINVDK